MALGTTALCAQSVTVSSCFAALQNTFYQYSINNFSSNVSETRGIVPLLRRHTPNYAQSAMNAPLVDAPVAGNATDVAGPMGFPEPQACPGHHAAAALLVRALHKFAGIEIIVVVFGLQYRRDAVPGA